MIPTADPCVSRTRMRSRCVIGRNIFTFICPTAGSRTTLGSENFIAITELYGCSKLQSKLSRVTAREREISRLYVRRVSHVADLQSVLRNLFISSSSTGGFCERRSGGYPRCHESAGRGASLRSCLTWLNDGCVSTKFLDIIPCTLTGSAYKRTRHSTRVARSRKERHLGERFVEPLDLR